MWKHFQELLQPTGYRVYRPGANLHSPYFDSERKLQVLETRKASLL